MALINHATPHLYATSKEWHDWVKAQPTSALEAERRLTMQMRAKTHMTLRDQIQVDFVVEAIDWELDERYN